MEHPPLSWCDECYCVEQDYDNFYDRGEEED